MKYPVLLRVAVSVALLLLVSYIDARTSFEVELAPFYVLPVAVFLYDVRVSTRASIIAGIFVIAVWTTIDHFIHPPYSLPLYWILNGLIKAMLCIVFVIVIRQYLALRVLRDELKKRNNELEGSNKDLNRFIGMAAHDIRNPVGAIAMTSEFLQEQEDMAEDTREHLKMIEVTARNSLEILDDTLNISQIQSGTLDLHLKEDDYLLLIWENIKLYKYRADARKQAIVIVNRPNQLRAVFDKRRLSQVFNNLLSNAIKYSPDKTTITISLETEGDWLKTSIKDEGQGIDEIYHENLFAPFSTTPNQPTHNGSKIGLGLAIAKRLVDMHHGTIGFISKPGAGSTFFYSIPRFAGSDTTGFQ